MEDYKKRKEGDSMINSMELRFRANNGNESFARTSVASFIMPLNPTIDQIDEVKTIVSEAVSNAIIHGYGNDFNKSVYVNVDIEDNKVTIIIQDYGKGIEDVSLVMQDSYSTKKDEEHAGMGMTIMKAFSDEFNIVSEVNIGTKVTLIKYIKNNE